MAADSARKDQFLPKRRRYKMVLEGVHLRRSQGIHFLLAVLTLSACHKAAPQSKNAAESQPPKVVPKPAAPSVADRIRDQNPSWTVLTTEPFRGKQDDISFASPTRGWYGNGSGRIFRTEDAGESWDEVLHKPGTFFRAIAATDETTVFAGNIGPDYFPNVSDAAPLYVSSDKGDTWAPVEGVDSKMLKGVCAIDVLHTNFINHGVLAPRTTIRAAGRVGGPAMMVVSRDAGKTWKSETLPDVAGMVLDVKFVSEQVGFVCAASGTSSENSNALILKTRNGGDDWDVVYRSKRNHELTWKCSFPTEKVGYATIQSYNPDPSASQRYVAKTSDGGDTWTELPLVDDHTVREFGIGFADEDTGWVGTVKGMWQTLDGGSTWTHLDVGTAINKLRIVRSEEGLSVFGIGLEVVKLVLKD